MSMITSLASGLSAQKQQATTHEVQVALVKKVLDSQKQMGGELLRLLSEAPTIQGADSVRGNFVDFYA